MPRRGGRAPARTILLAAHLVSGPAWAASPDCDALRDSQVPFVLTIREAGTTLTRGGDTTAMAPFEYRQRVLRGGDGRVTTFLLSEREGEAPVVSEKRYWRILASTNPDGVRTVLTHELPLPYDPVARREDFTEIYTRSVPGKPALRRRMDAVFVGEGDVLLGPCRFKTYRYRATWRAEPSPDGKAISVSTIDLAPELMIPLRTESHHDLPGLAATQARAAVGIARE